MKNQFTFVLAFILLVSVGTHAQVVGQSDEDKIKRIGELAATEFAKDNVGSLSIAVIMRSGKIWTKSHGSAANAIITPANDRTVYRIGSITKQFTAIMFVQLLNQGKVRLSDPVEKYLPEVNNLRGRYKDSPPITLVQLATHMAGLSAEPDGAETFTSGPVKNWQASLRSALPKTKFVAEPGSSFSYSNIGYAILGAALEKAAKEPYIDYVRNNIFRPLGMNDTTFELNDDQRARLAVGYEIKEGMSSSAVSEKEHLGRGYKVPNGGAYSTVSDMAKFVSFELGNGPTSVLTREQLDQNFSRLILSNSNLTGGYGLGFEMFRRDDLLGFGHSGLVVGYESAAYFTRNTRTAVIMLRSATGGAFRGTRLCISILRELNSPAQQP
jgi:CubicO group peptidase (beta-lactamase class C family)